MCGPEPTLRGGRAALQPNSTDRLPANQTPDVGCRPQAGYEKPCLHTFQQYTLFDEYEPFYTGWTCTKCGEPGYEVPDDD